MTELIDAICAAAKLIPGSDLFGEFFALQSSPETRCEYDEQRLRNAKSESDSRTSHYFTQWTTKSYEVAVRTRGFSPVPLRMRQTFTYEDHEHGITYKYGPASDAYIIGIIAAVKDGIIDDSIFSGNARPRYDEPVDLFDHLKNVGFRYFTITVSSLKNRSKEEFQSLLQAVIFQVSYNSNIMLIPVPNRNHSTRNPRFAKNRRRALDTIDPPRRSYTTDLLHHYNMAVESDNPFASFISYYHVLEHFFEIVFNNDVVEMVRNKITLPGFSYKRRKDVDALVKDIKRQFRIQAENITFNEQEALKLVLKEFCEIEELKMRLLDFGDEVLEYYKTSEVSFSKGAKISFDGADDDVYKSLSKRIYLTRCSLVHSKDGEKNKYTPYIDDDHLQKEIPLLRTLAEQVIIANSKVIES